MLITRGAHLWCVLCLTLAISACSGGGGGDDTPILPWGRLRAGVANAALASGTLANNLGGIKVVLQLGCDEEHPCDDDSPASAAGITGSTPIIGTNELIYLGTTAGLLVMNKDGTQVRMFTECDTAPDERVPESECLAENGCVPVAPVSGTAAINVNNDVVFGDDAGRVFAFHDDGMTLECLWVFPAPLATPIPGGVVSSPLIFSDGFDRTLMSAYLGIGSGHLQALNNFGTSQWRFPSDDPFPGPVTSSVALSIDGASLQITAPDGFLYSVDRAGRLQHQARISLATDATNLLPSSMSGTSTYAVGVGGNCGDAICLEEDGECSGVACRELEQVGVVTALTPLNEVRWRFATDVPIAGSAAFVVQVINEPAAPLATPTPAPTPPTPDPSTPTPRRQLVSEGIVYVVDTKGTVYGVKDASGTLFDAQPPAATATPVRVLTPDEPTPTATATGLIPPKPARADLDLEEPITVTSSPVLSADLFVLFGTNRGEVYAIRLDFDRTSPCSECSASEWNPAPLEGEDFGGGGVVNLPSGGPVVSSPIIDSLGTIFVTAGDVSTGKGTLYSVGSP